MSWEKFEESFPDGAETECGFFTADQLRENPDIGVISIPFKQTSGSMVTRSSIAVYGKDNEFAIIDSYNIDNEIKHVSAIHPLNEYGTAMLRDYLEYNIL